MSASPPSRSRSFSARMTAKVGPLPVWAWALALLVVGYLIYRHTSSSSSSSSDTSSTADTGSTDATAPTTDTSTSGSPGPDQAGGATANAGPDAASLNDTLLSQLSGFQGSLDALTQALLSSSAFAPGSGDSGSGSLVPNGTTPPGPGGGAAVATHTGGTRTTTRSGATLKPAPTLVSEHGQGGGYMPPANVRYYTYAPGKAPKGQKANEAPASVPGKTLHFAAGRGYYYA